MVLMFELTDEQTGSKKVARRAEPQSISLYKTVSCFRSAIEIDSRGVLGIAVCS